MSGDRSNWSCSYCDSSDVFRTDGDLFECERCGLQTSEAREATVNHNSDGETLGAAVYLSGNQLEALDVDLDSDRVRYHVQNGQLQIEGVTTQ